MSNYSFSREIIKWVNSLNLSVPYSDVHRTLQNGFLVAEITSKYYPYLVTMHSYSNSQKSTDISDNWDQLKKIFKKC